MRINKTIFIYRLFLVLIFSGLHMNAAGFDSLKVKRSIGRDIVNDIVISTKDAGAYFTIPFHLSANGWLWTAGIIGGTAGIMAADRELKKAIGRNTIETFNHDFWDAPTVYGFVQYPSIAAGVVYLTGLFTRNDDIRITGRLWLESLAYSGVTAIGLRYLTGRYRAYYSDDQWKYTWFQPKNDTQSFPSGHTVVAFATSTVLAERINTWWARVVLYGFATLTAYARVLNNQHWMSDVVVGGLLGFGTGWYVVHREEEREKDVKKGKKGGNLGERGVFVYPMFNGVSLIYRF